MIVILRSLVFILFFSTKLLKVLEKDYASPCPPNSVQDDSLVELRGTEAKKKKKERERLDRNLKNRLLCREREVMMKRKKTHSIVRTESTRASVTSCYMCQIWSKGIKVKSESFVLKVLAAQ